MVHRQVSRPPFSPLPCAGDAFAPLVSTPSAEWVPICLCYVDFPPTLFEVAAEQLIHHPEYNSTLILRSETLHEMGGDDADLPDLLQFTNLTLLRNIQRRLIPRRPGRDNAVDQHCTLYGNTSHEPVPTCLVLTPVVPAGKELPYYHPAVSYIAFRYIAAIHPTSETHELHDTAAQLRVEVVPLPDTADPTDPNSRLYRTCLALLDTLHRYCWGALNHYKKRVMHDALVPREIYQDTYLVMRERHKHLVETWQEATDPLKHVFEDIGIATFLMLLWRDTYNQDDKSLQSAEMHASNITSDPPPWHSWPRPPGGFLDIGCGNGLLTHILTSEGYNGFGIDVRARASWSQYPAASQACLRVHALNPISMDNPADLIPRDAFIIANHADELTPWAPVLATLHAASGYLSIPCCAWSFDAKFARAHTDRSANAVFPVSLKDTPAEFVDALALGGDGSGNSAYSMYRVWLAHLAEYCGWKIECETLRIPSTRNWAIAGRKKRIAEGVDEGNFVENARAIVRSVRERALFKPRRPEGKAGEH